MPLRGHSPSPSSGPGPQESHRTCSIKDQKEGGRGKGGKPGGRRQKMGLGQEIGLVRGKGGAWLGLHLDSPRSRSRDKVSNTSHFFGRMFQIGQRARGNEPADHARVSKLGPPGGSGASLGLLHLRARKLGYIGGMVRFSEW